MAYPPVGGTVRIRLIDYEELPLVLTMGPNGMVEASHPGMCKIEAARILRRVAAQMVASHAPDACTPDDEQPIPEHRPAEPVDASGSSLDRERRVWSDGTGHTWDLSVTWADQETGNEWRWMGRVDRSGAPVLHAVGYPGISESLDVLRAMYGPIYPAVGGGRS